VELLPGGIDHRHGRENMFFMEEFIKSKQNCITHHCFWGLPREYLASSLNQFVWSVKYKMPRGTLHVKESLNFGTLQQKLSQESML
jgi:hypothetical protein